MTTHPKTPGANFAKAYWSWLKREARDDGQEPQPPVPSAYGLADSIGESIARQCTIDFQDKQIKRSIALGKERNK